MRTFRLDRISSLEPTEKPILHRAGDVQLPDELFQGSADDLLVTIDVALSALALVADYMADGATISTVDGRQRTSIHVSHYHALKRLVAGLPGVVTVVEPAEARRVVAEWAASGAARYGS